MEDGKNSHIPLQTTYKKRGAGLPPVPRCKGLRIAQLVETSNVESPTLMFMYINVSSTNYKWLKIW